MVDEIQQNLETYHSVFAKSIMTTYDTILKGPEYEKIASKIVILNWVFGKGLDDTSIDISNVSKIDWTQFDLEMEKFNKLPIEKQWFIMAKIQDKVGLVAVQKKTRTSWFKRIANLHGK